MSLRNTATAVTVAVLAALGVLAGGASSSKAVSSDTTAAPQSSGLPAPYSRKPDIYGTMVSSPILIHPKTTRSFLMLMSWQGNAKTFRLYLDKLPKGWTLLKKGSTSFHVVEGTATWVGTNINKSHNFEMRVHIGLSPTTPRGRAYYTLHWQANNGPLMQQDTVHGYLWMRK
jgi:hypothetical protein